MGKKRATSTFQPSCSTTKIRNNNNNNANNNSNVNHQYHHQSKTTNSTNAPIPLPHDGPIHRTLLQLLNRRGLRHGDDDDDDDAVISSNGVLPVVVPMEEHNLNTAAITKTMINQMIVEIKMIVVPPVDEEETTTTATAAPVIPSTTVDECGSSNHTNTTDSNKNIDTDSTDNNNNNKQIVAVDVVAVLQQLLETLVQATHVHEQLQALQKFRNYILQQQQQQRKVTLSNTTSPPTTATTSSSTTTTTTTTATTTTTTTTTPTTTTTTTTTATRTTIEQQHLLFVYRILVEWMISYRTSMTLRRAIQSCLSVLLLLPLHNNNDDDDTATEKSNAFLQNQRIRIIGVTLDSIILPPINATFTTATTTSISVQSVWMNPLFTLNELLTWEPMEKLLLDDNNNNTANNCTSQLERILQFVATQTTTKTIGTDSTATTATTIAVNDSTSDTTPATQTTTTISVDNIVLMANLINKFIIMLMTNATSASLVSSRNNNNNSKNTKNEHDDDAMDRMDATVRQLRQYIWNCITMNPNIPVDRLSNIGISYGRIIQFYVHNSCCNDTSSSTTTTIIETTLQQISTLPSALHRMTLLQGMAVIIPLGDDGDHQHHATTMTMSSLVTIIQACQRIVIEELDPGVRCLALKGLRTLMSRVNNSLLLLSSSENSRGYLQQQKSSSLNLDVVRTVAHDVLQVVLQAWENPSTRKLANAIPALFETVLQVMMKLSIDLNEVLVDRILAQPPNLKGRYLALEVMMPITGVTRFIQTKQDETSTTLLNDLLLGIGDHGHNTGVIADLWAKVLRQLRIEFHELHGANSKNDNSVSHPADEDPWLQYWVPSLCQALLSPDFIRRKQTAAFCLPRIVAMEISVSASRTATAPIFEAILASIQELSSVRKVNQRFVSLYASRETYDDRIVWAELEVIRYAALEGLMKPTSDSPSNIRNIVAALFPEIRLRAILSHSSMTIRAVAFQVLDSVISSYVGTVTSSLDCLRAEADMWKYALPYSIKTEGKEFTLTVLQCLLLFLDRLSISEATYNQSNKVNEVPQPTMSIFHDFVVHFLLHDIALEKAGYPGTVALKESFLLSLLECIIVFSSREHPLAMDSKLLPKSAAVFRRRRLDHEERVILEAKKALLTREIFACCISLLHSTWDITRNTTYRIIMSLVQLGKADSIELPKVYTDVDERGVFLRRGVFLASSPRQREADTGARLIAFLFVAASNECDKVELFESLIDLLARRLECMKQRLSALLSCDNTYSSQQLPLAHGVIHALRLLVESDDVVPINGQLCRNTAILVALDRFTSLLFDAIRISLAVVADVKDGENVDGMDEELVSELGIIRGKPTHMINPSAIGANGIFSSVSRISDSEHSKRLVSQRLIVGSWLLTKETCGGLATLLSMESYTASYSTYQEAGTLLISTLTSLKHTGAAFAAHRSLQRIAQSCYSASLDHKLYLCPEKWAARIIDEVSNSDKIRDSTLRRSTGYSLGVISLMRAEGMAHPHHSLCRTLLFEMLTLCLPSTKQAESFADKIQLSEALKKSLYCFSGDHGLILARQHSDTRSRVHALNILRSILLDAPLARDVYPFVGIALIASIIGYTDSEWSVRNSSTMVFAAAMLRSIDSDKNVSNTDVTGRNPVTAYELFRSYPSLRPFLLAVLTGGVQGAFDYHQTLSLPPVLPILLLLARINPVSRSGHDSMVQVEPFVPLILQLIGHKELIIRKGASNALRNIVSMDRDSTTSIRAVLWHCQENLVSLFNTRATHDQWNQLHGILLTILELVRSYPEAKPLLSCYNTTDCIVAISRLYDGSPIIPPPCLAISIEVLWIMLNSHEDNRLYDLCKGITSWLTCSDQQNLNDVGSTELAAQVTAILARLDSSTLWDNDISFDRKEAVLQQLSALLHSNCIDVRLAASKAFKKSMFRNMEKLLISHDSTKVAEKLAVLILSAMEKELSRGIQHNFAHVPTLRRLSRCLVVCIAQASNVDLVRNLRRKSTLLAWQMLKVAADKCDPDLLTLSDGSSLEMIYAEFNNLEQNQNQGLLLLTDRFSNSSCPWRVRLSAALTFQRLAQENGATRLIFDSSLGLQSWVTLMQDEDIDVRNVTSSATHQPDSSKSSSYITELAFAQDMRCFVASAPTECAIKSLLHAQLRLCDKSADVIDSTINELYQSCNGDLFSTVVNEGMTRHIFESDTPNSYHERCFVCQLVAVSVLQLQLQSSIHMDTGLTTRANDFLKSTVTMMSKLLESTIADTSVYEIMHSSTIFPLLHNQIIGTLTLVCLFGGNSVMIQEIQMIATMIVSTSSDTSRAWKFHPLIVKALQALAMDSTQSNTKATLSLYQCCFLFSQDEPNGHSSVPENGFQFLSI